MATTPGPARDLYSLGIRAARYTNNRMLTAAAEGKAPVGDYCHAGQWIVVIDEKGEVFPCEPLWESVGNIREHDYDLRSVLAGDRYAKFRDQRLCNGSCNCTWGVALSNSIAARPRFFPELAVNSTRVLWNQRKAQRNAASRGPALEPSDDGAKPDERPVPDIRAHAAGARSTGTTG